MRTHCSKLQIDLSKCPFRLLEKFHETWEKAPEEESSIPNVWPVSLLNFKPFGFDNERVVSHQKLKDSWVQEGLMSPYILCEFRIYYAEIREFKIYDATAAKTSQIMHI